MREHLERLGFDSAELSRQANGSAATVSRWLNDDAQPSVKVIPSTAQALGVPTIDAMIAAEALTPDDLGVNHLASDPALLCNEDLVRQLEERLRLAATSAAAAELSPPPPSVPAGWYSDPAGLPTQRYWDGFWTEHTASTAPWRVS
ncbi:Helix-turn-helix [Rhodococcus triatomae]|uniref:Helix-turn-helix n=1 Tax=Rhodococcus triatomae TaxID=300028 RepID=A0A1G8CP35_9NOCA|nr:DUF2510 domain-containing protein [Rhodococcus triatomae]SDH47317.1 Helix-turn-helix [Rhodococcus triatomae]